MFVQGAVTIPAGEPGKLSVVQLGPPSGSLGSSVPVVVRNNTKDELERVEVNATARDGAGTIIGSGSSQNFEPETLGAGQWGFGYIYFDTAIAADAAIEATASGSEPSSISNPFDKFPMKVNELQVQQDQYSGPTYLGTVTNPSTTENAEDPISVQVGCFDAESKIQAVHNGFADGTAPPGGTASFSVSSYSTSPTCPNIVVVSSARSL